VVLTCLGEVKVIEGEGVPSYRHHDFGNLYIRFEIEFPTPEWARAAGEGALPTLR
jgi:DnaJ family protein A protein 2